MLSFLDDNHIKYQLIGDYKPASSKFKLLNQFSIYLSYLGFLIFGFFELLKNKDSVLYYESISVMPIVVYLFFFRKSNLRIFAHFHEYFSKEEYAKQSLLERVGRKYELALFKKAEWISHTNQDRLELFKKDIDFNVDPFVLKTMPNYPSKSWMSTIEAGKMENDGKIRLLHIGSISLNGMYLLEVLDHYGNNENFEIHFYSHTTDEGLIKKLKNYSCVFYHGSIDYDEIPKLKGKFDVGLVLYKGKSLNFTYNAPNKIFEYLAMDLDVWCSDKLLTSRHYVCENTFPKLIMVDFENLNEFDENIAIDKTGLSYKKSTFYYENVYTEFLKQLKEIK